ncbi:MAG TPA: DNA replication and repair protein RecF [Candidatus Babeliales bacterium]|nr:DNA replication and repair protein RecF [Candidatus Babeliales bacterium]
MFLKELQLKHFRCFAQKNISFESPLVLIEGINGTGKTSLVEALHYLCYLRSFRTHSPRELLQAGQSTFFIKAIFNHLEQEGDQELQVGFSGAKRLVKINQKVVCSYKELIDHYRIITLTQDDIELIKGGPEIRRAFIDQVILLYDPEFIAKIRLVRQIADNRNRMLQGNSFSKDLYAVLTEQLWAASQEVQFIRASAIDRLAQETKAMLSVYFDDQVHISLDYKPKMVDLGGSCQQFIDANPQLMSQEQRYGRSLFGAHLDDFSINFEHKRSKSYASRGQQKLIIILLKIAQMRELLVKKGAAVFLLDDFLTDFDEGRAQTILASLADLKGQLIFTAPARSDFLEGALGRMGAQKLILTH